MSLTLLLIFCTSLNVQTIHGLDRWLKRPTPSTSHVQRTQAETQFIASEFGVLVPHKRLSKRDQLALRLTLLQVIDD